METTDNVIARIEAGNLMKYETLLKHSRAQDARVAELEALLARALTESARVHPDFAADIRGALKLTSKA